jgi:S1-C subfamily serine protease
VSSDWGSRERRATDGLDWREDRPGAPEQPSSSPEAPPPPPGGGRKRGLVLPFGAGILGGLAVLAVSMLIGGESKDSAPASVDSLTLEQTSAISESAAIGRGSVVRIESTRRTATGIEQDVGSGVIIDSAGHIITNAHVVLGTETLKVVLADGTERPAILLGHDYPFTDIAVLQIGPSQLSPVRLGRSASLTLGEPLIAIGNPLAEFAGSVTVGVVSGLNRSRQFDGVLQTDLIQTDAAINNGNSGGALLNSRGELVGIPTAVLRQSRSGATVEGIAFALPVDRIRPIIEQIIRSGQSYPRPSLGLEHAELTPELLTRNPRIATDKGALVVSVTPGGVADAAGITVGDVIVKVNGAELSGTLPLLNVLATLEPGATVKVVFNRNGRIIETDVRLAKRG